MKPQLREALRAFFYQRDYDNKLAKNAYVLADEVLDHIDYILKQFEPKPEPPKPEEFVTIGGITYKKEEVKK
ncbi:MAG TPA: hypothetical protein VFQ56_03905 [Flavobacterium sp.]|nr:hypothetical protein [Flavobacterium sp.]